MKLSLRNIHVPFMKILVAYSWLPMGHNYVYLEPFEAQIYENKPFRHHGTTASCTTTEAGRQDKL